VAHQDRIKLAVTALARHTHMLELLYHFLAPEASVVDGTPMVPEAFNINMLNPSQQLPDYDKVK
jgi:hypothetical protein